MPVEYLTSHQTVVGAIPRLDQAALNLYMQKRSPICECAGIISVPVPAGTKKKHPTGTEIKPCLHVRFYFGPYRD